MRSWRLGSGMFGAFAVLAIVLATVGLYGMLSYDVAQRAPEFGVRMALGATDGRVVQLIVSRAVGVMMVGGGFGFATALAAGVLVAPLLFQTSAREPSVYLFVLMVMGSIVLIATLLPAMRATKVQPSSALRSEERRRSRKARIASNEGTSHHVVVLHIMTDHELLYANYLEP